MIPSPPPSPKASAELESIRRVLPWLIAVSFFMETMDITILNTAVPTIAAALGVVPLDLKSALTSYALSLALFIPLSGWMADRFGTRRVFHSAIAIFGIGSLLCGMATNLHMLVGARIVQGLGGAMMMPVGRIAIARTFPKAELVRAMSFVVIPGLIGPLLGPVIGGLIVTHLHWRVIFFVNLPFALVGLWAVGRFMPDYHQEQPPPLDVRGFLLFSGGLVLLSYTLEVFGQHDHEAGLLVALVVAALTLLGLYVRHAFRHPQPLFPPSLFQVRTFRTSTTGGFISRLGIGGMPFLLPLYYQVGLGYSPVQAAGLIVPQPLASITLKFVAPTLLKRHGHRRILMVNTILLGLIMAAFSTVGVETPVYVIIAQAFCFGFCMSMQFTSVNTLLFADLTPELTSRGSSLGSALQQLSMSLGVAIASLVTALFLQDGEAAASSAYTAAIRQTFWVLGAITLVSSLLFLPLRPEDGASMSGRGGEDGDETA